MKIDLIGIVKKFLNKFLSTRTVFCIDLLVSVICSLLSIFVMWIVLWRNPYAFQLAPFYLIASFLASGFIFALLRTHHIVIRHTTLLEEGVFFQAAFLKCLVLAALLTLWRGWGTISYMLPLEDAIITFVALIGLRCYMQAFYEYVRGILKKDVKRSDTLILGTDDKSIALCKSLVNSVNHNVKGFLQLSGQKSYQKICNLHVYSALGREDLEQLKEELHLDSILIPTLEEVRKTDEDNIVNMAIDAGLDVWFTPNLDKIEDGDQLPLSSHVRKIRIEDLLGRDEIKISLDETRKRFEGKTILITGAAGSIGSELTRQIATMGAGKIVLFDNAETPLHNLRLELEDKYGKGYFEPIIGDVRQKTRLEYVFRRFNPQIIFHAAAYKHVPLMEENPCEAVLVNSIGSRNVANIAVKYNAEMMVMVSTDKAVNPTNVMGCSKRIAEIYIQSLGLAIERGEIESRTRFVTTRFGNVLGSNGSVIPRFKEQIEKGGPITVTHKDITRFFMTIPEACRLVMEASTLSTGNQIFVFDMGKPVKIVNLAKRMIQLSGLVPDKDIQIVYTGLRPGEKLYEEVLATQENTTATSHERIRIANVRSYDYNVAKEMLSELKQLSLEVRIPELVKRMKAFVPEYISNNSQFECFDKESEPAEEEDILNIKDDGSFGK